jgi:hypothetical protein
MGTITAMVGRLKQPMSLSHMEEVLKDYREVQQRFIEGERRDFVKEVKDLRRDGNAIRFKFRWDDVRTWEEDEETREARQTFRCEAALRNTSGLTYLFVYASAQESGYALARLSEALFRRARQIAHVAPTAALFEWILKEELTSAKHGGFRIVRLPGTEHATVSGSFNPKENPYWRTYKRDGVITSLRYEHSGREREYSISSSAVYSVEGKAVDAAELEKYVLTVLVPHL